MPASSSACWRAEASYQAAAISGAGVSESLLGWADRGILTFDQNLNACRLLTECVDIPLLADADIGYGNALTVHFVVRAFEKAKATWRDERVVGPDDEGRLEPKMCFSPRRSCHGDL
jgi:2-methylisocitrate lyase-like PEP mutase family enzyme